MKLLWLCNLTPDVVQQKMFGSSVGGMWVDQVLAGLRQREDLQIHVFCPNALVQSGAVDERCTYETFRNGKPEQYLPELEKRFAAFLQEYKPDVIHIWGTEFAHTLAMVNACEKQGLLDRVAISIQGLCSVCAGHYMEGLPLSVCYGYTFRDFVKQDNIRQQQRTFARRGELEVEALKKVRHVIGRTEWDFACTQRIHPGVHYHFCNETLREPFYEGQWQYETCQKHRIFAPSAMYPLKGFHYLLEAFAEVLKTYPDATLALPGRNPAVGGLKTRLRQNSYKRYLAKRIQALGLQGKVEFLGRLSAEQMKENYLRANVFVSPSAIENSPNSLGEAMLLGVPCVASDVGGVTTLMRHWQEGFVYQSTAPYMLAHYIQKVFAMGEEATRLGEAARAHARVTHDPGMNLEDLLDIYSLLAQQEGE